MSVDQKMSSWWLIKAIEKIVVEETGLPADDHDWDRIIDAVKESADELHRCYWIGRSEDPVWTAHEILNGREVVQPKEKGMMEK